MHDVTTATPTKRRVDAIDLLRGLVMVVMLLDHTRDFVHRDVRAFDPLDPERTTVVLYLTRWITHFCAPTFVLLAGTGAYLYGRRCASRPELARFLATRGLWLIAVEVLVLRPLLFFDFDLELVAFLQVIWAIGASMLVLAALVGLRVRTIAVLGLATVALHNTLDRFRVESWNGPGTHNPTWPERAWTLLHDRGQFSFVDEQARVVVVAYPLLPWIGVMACGYALGALYELDAARRRRILVAIGTCAVIVFVALRALDVYGDPKPWSRQPSAVQTAMSFLDTEKYPPSLLFLAMTLGPALIALAAFERVQLGALGRALVTLGRVPFFFYVLQWPLLHVIAMLFARLAGQPFAWQAELSLPFVYVAWLVALLVLFPLSAWFAGVKRRSDARWSSFV